MVCSAAAFFFVAVMIAAPAASQMTAQHTTDQTGDDRMQGPAVDLDDHWMYATP